MDARGNSPKLVELSELATGEHRRSFIRDFRERFNLSVYDIGLTVRYDEAFELVLSLSADPSSWLHASMLGWEFPVTRGEAYTLDLIDVQLARALGDKFKPSPRPWDKKRAVRKTGKPGRTASEAHRLLRPHLYND